MTARKITAIAVDASSGRTTARMKTAGPMPVYLRIAIR